MGEEIKKFLMERMKKEFKKVREEQAELFENQNKKTSQSVGEIDRVFQIHRDNSINQNHALNSEIANVSDLCKRLKSEHSNLVNRITDQVINMTEK